MKSKKIVLEDLSKINIEFVTSKDHKTFTSTGAWGGLNPQGEIVCHFFIEKQAFPDNVRVNMDIVTGQVVEESEGDKYKFIREVQHTLVLRPDIARTIGAWLIEKADDFNLKVQQGDTNELPTKH